MRVIAIDWSGALKGAAKKVWLAEVVEGRLVCVEDGRSREQVANYLISEAERDSRMLVGFDFAFSLPAWFLRERGLKSARELWALAAREAEEWLARCEPPFWGRPGKKRPVLDPGQNYLRRTDASVPDTGGIRPKSVFQIGGAGAVGTGSLRGMLVLSRLTAAGFAIWPFDQPGLPQVVEIYPRLLTGTVNKSDASKRAAYLFTNYDTLDRGLGRLAASNENAFDAAVSALVMAENLNDLMALPAATDEQTRLEGKIWHPFRRSRPAPV